MTNDEEAAVRELAGLGLEEIAAKLITAADETSLKDIAHAELGEEREPTEDEIAAVKERLVEEAVGPLLRADVRNKVLLLQSLAEQIIDIASQDTLISAGFIESGEAKAVVDGFQEWIRDHHDEYVALKAYFEQPYSERLTLKDIKDLAKAIEAPPLNFTPQRLWAAYRKIDAAKVKGDGKILADIVSLIRFAVGRDDELTPHADQVKLRFDFWLEEQENDGRKFGAIQRGWLMMVRDHMATSLTIEPDDFDLDPFSQEGGLVAAYQVFGNDLNPLLAELNERLAV